MKMKVEKKLFTLAAALFLTSTLYAQDGASLFNAKCAACHQTTRPSDRSTLIAPPLMGVMRHVKMQYTTKDAAVKFIAAYVLDPQASKAVCKPQNMKRFGIMPSQKGNVTKEELQTISAWMYDNFPPKGLQGIMGKGQGNKGYQSK
jgi:cytochrome c